jgi:hypothetical protein
MLREACFRQRYAGLSSNPAAMKYLSYFFVLALAATPLTGIADATGDLQQAAAAFNAQKAFHADEHFSNGEAVTVDYIPTDRIRVVNAKHNTTTLIIGSDFWVQNNGKWTKLPSFAAHMVTSRVDQYRHLYPTDIAAVKDLGMQNVNGKMLHAYSFTSGGVPATMWIDAKHLPAQMVTTSRGITTTITYSYNNVTITPPQ